MRIIIKAAFVLIALSSLLVNAAGFGTTTVQSKLGQPLKLEIEVLGVSEFSNDNLRFTVADKEAYKNMDVEFSFSHYDLKMHPQRDSDDDVTLIIKSERPFNEPFINFVLQLKSPSGIYLKEISALIEPPKI